jgi:hypothetical protein
MVPYAGDRWYSISKEQTKMSKQTIDLLAKIFAIVMIIVLVASTVILAFF